MIRVSMVDVDRRMLTEEDEANAGIDDGERPPS